MSKDTRTYRVTVEIGRDTDPDLDRAVVTVNGDTYRYPWHWEDSAKSLARRAVLENYRVDSVTDVTEDRHGKVFRGSFFVTGRVF